MGARFLKKLGFWSIHCSINALPSYLIAVVWLGLWGSMTAQLAMLAAVVTFILGYSVFTAWWPALREEKSLFSRALKVGLVIRTIISVLTVLAIPLATPLLFAPDTWCGVAASWAVSEVLGTSPLGQRLGSDSMAAQVGFLEVYATTLLEGLILSFMLFILSFISIIILQMRDRRNPMLWQGRPNP